MQRLLNHADWNADAVRDDLGAYVVEHLGDDAAVLVVDETGFLKKGTKSAGVARQYSGTAGRIENCRVGVFLAYAAPAGRTFLDRELYLPRAWLEDRARCAEAGIGADVEFRTKPGLALAMLTRALDAGVPAGWVAADEVYGQNAALRLALEERGLPYVLAVPVNQYTIAAATGRIAQTRVDGLSAALPEAAWSRLSAGAGAKGPRVYDWARLPSLRAERRPAPGTGGTRPALRAGLAGQPVHDRRGHRADRPDPGRRALRRPARGGLEPVVGRRGR